MPNITCNAVSINDWSSDEYVKYLSYKYNSSNYNKIGGQVHPATIENFDKWHKIFSSIENKKLETCDMEDFIRKYVEDKLVIDKLNEEYQVKLQTQLQEMIDDEKNQRLLEKQKMENIKHKILELKSLIESLENGNKEQDLIFIDECLVSIDKNLKINYRDLIILNRLHSEYINIKNKSLNDIKIESANQSLEEMFKKIPEFK